MIFSQKIFVNDNPLILTTNRDEYISRFPQSAGYTVFQNAAIQDFISAFALLEKGDKSGIILEGESEGTLLNQLHSLYHPIEAAGGVVFNERQDVLMIYRRGKWDLPKGKLDIGEDLAKCALREVSEETGLTTLSITQKVCDTFHIYTDKEPIVKRTAWYKMLGSSADLLSPQKEESIMEARWVNPNDISGIVALSYEAVREVMRIAGIQF